MSFWRRTAVVLLRSMLNVIGKRSVLDYEFSKGSAYLGSVDPTGLIGEGTAVTCLPFFGPQANIVSALYTILPGKIMFYRCQSYKMQRLFEELKP